MPRMMKLYMSLQKMSGLIMCVVCFLRNALADVDRPQSQPPMANWYSGVLKYVHRSPLDAS